MEGSAVVSPQHIQKLSRPLLVIPTGRCAVEGGRESLRIPPFAKNAKDGHPSFGDGDRLRDENDPAFIALAGPGLFDFGQRHRFDVNRKLELFGGGEHGA